MAMAITIGMSTGTWCLRITTRGFDSGREQKSGSSNRDVKFCFKCNF